MDTYYLPAVPSKDRVLHGCAPGNTTTAEAKKFVDEYWTGQHLEDLRARLALGQVEGRMLREEELECPSGQEEDFAVSQVHHIIYVSHQRRHPLHNQRRTPVEKIYLCVLRQKMFRQLKLATS
jgi:hypothetical protein